MQARRLQDTGRSEILLPYIYRVLDPEKGAIFLTSVLSLSKKYDEMVERFEYVFDSVLVQHSVNLCRIRISLVFYFTIQNFRYFHCKFQTVGQIVACLKICLTAVDIGSHVDVYNSVVGFFPFSCLNLPLTDDSPLPSVHPVRRTQQITIAKS